MPKMTRTEVVSALRGIDLTMLSTLTAEGPLASRPMSNNGEVEYSGTSWYFTWENARMCGQIRANPNVSLSFQGTGGLFGAPPLFLFVQGKARVVTDRAAFAEHWNTSLNRWFPDGPETPGVAMLEVVASHITYWSGEDSETLTL